MTLPPPGDPLRVLAFGTFGSLLVEVVTASRLQNRGRPLPARYRHWDFYLIRSLLAAGSGVLAVAYAVTSDILAVQIGITTPTLVDTMIHPQPKPDHEDPPPA